MKTILALIAASVALATVAVATNGQAKEAASCCKEKAKVAASIEGGKEACCKSTAAKPQAKGEGSCCNAKGQLAKFKVFAEGKYHYFGCEGSAKKGRADLVAQGYVGVGQVQKVKGKVAI